MANTIPPEAMLEFYRNGLFPMAGPDGLRLYSPDPRGIIPLEGFRIPHGTRKSLRDPAWTVTINTAFDDVVSGCAERADTWIDGTIFRSYSLLHRLGHAHSVEVWRDGALAGGLYGVAIGGAFFGESMFHRVSGASKVALCHLIARLRANGFSLLDTQWTTPHLEQFGAKEIPRAHYMEMLARGIAQDATFADSADKRPRRAHQEGPGIPRASGPARRE